MIMNKVLWDVRFLVDGLLPPQVTFAEKVWLKRGHIYLEKRGDQVGAHVLHEGEHVSGADEKILPYFKFVPLLTSNAAEVTSGGGSTVASKKVFVAGGTPFLDAVISIGLPEEAVSDVSACAPKFLREIKRLHDKYTDVVDENRFVSIGLDFLCESNNKSVYTDEGFLSAVISLEALLNEGAGDIRYKVALRTAFLLGLATDDSPTVFRNLKAIYTKRNNLVHGAVSGAHTGDPELYNASRYARRVMMTFLILLKRPRSRKIRKKDRKKELLQEIDYAILDGTKRHTLQREIASRMKDFQLGVPRTFEGEDECGQPWRTTPW